MNINIFVKKMILTRHLIHAKYLLYFDKINYISLNSEIQILKSNYLGVTSTNFGMPHSEKYFLKKNISSTNLRMFAIPRIEF